MFSKRNYLFALALLFVVSIFSLRTLSQESAYAGDTVYLQAQQSEPDIFDLTKDALGKYMGADFWIIIAVVMLGMGALKEITSKNMNYFNPQSTTNEKVSVRVCQLSEFWIKCILVGVTISFIILVRGMFGKAFLGFNPVFEMILVFIVVILLYFAGGKWVVEKLMMKLFKTQYHSAITLEEYQELGKVEEKK